MPCYGLVLDPSFGFARVHGVEADRVDDTGEQMTFWHNGQLVYQIPARFVRRLETFDTRTEAMEWLREAGRKGGRSGMQGAEVRAARGPQRSPVIERVTVAMEDAPKRR